MGGDAAGLRSALKAFRADLERDASVNRLRRFGQACVLAHELPADVDWIHTHYLHTPASVARYAALIRGMGWSFSAHAKDIWTTPEWELREKLADAAWGVTCTRANLEYLRSLSAEPKKIHLVYHGLDFSRFPPPPERKARSSGAVHDRVGRACGGEEGLCRPAPGAGADRRRAATGASSMPAAAPLAKRLKEQAAKLGIADRMIWHGAQDRAFIFAMLKRADLFVLPVAAGALGRPRRTSKRADGGAGVCRAGARHRCFRHPRTGDAWQRPAGSFRSAIRRRSPKRCDADRR